MNTHQMNQLVSSVYNGGGKSIVYHIETQNVKSHDKMLIN